MSPVKRPVIVVVPPVFVDRVIVPEEYVPPVTKLKEVVDTVPPVELPILKVPVEFVNVTPVVTGIVYDVPVKKEDKFAKLILYVQVPSTIGITSVDSGEL